MPDRITQLTAEKNKVPERRDRGETRRRNRKILVWLLAAFLSLDGVLALTLGYFYFLRASYFSLQRVEVEGTRRLSRTEVIEAAQVEPGCNLLTMDISAVATRLRRHPWIRKASVFRRFPGQLLVEIEERTPKAILAADRLYYVDEEASFFTRLLPGDSVEFPLFTGLTTEDMQMRSSEAQQLIRSGLGLLDLVEHRGTELETDEIAEIRLHLDEGLLLTMRSGRHVVLGKGNYETKLQRYGRLKRLLTRQGQWNNARTINFDFEDRALVRWSDKSRVQG